MVNVYTAYLLGKLGPKKQNRQFKLEFGAANSLNMQNLMLAFTFPVFDWKYTFWVSLVQKNQGYQLRLKFGNRTNLNLQNSMVVLSFSVFGYK